jgi:hypothetical protein
LFFDKHVCQIIEIKTQAIHVSETEQERDMHEHDVKCDDIDRDFQIYYVDREDLIDVESDKNDSFLVQNQKCFVDSLQNRKLFDIFERMISCIVIDQYAFEFAIIVS